MIDLDSMSDDDKLAALESIHKSIAESKEVQKQKIAVNVDLVLQALKKMESDIRARYDETGKAIEKRVANIKDGRNGQDGVDGRAGKDGRPGRDGATGPRGIDGLNGSNGIDGQDGISITDAHIDFDGSLIITLSDGKLLNVGEVVSQDIAEKIKVINTMSTNASLTIEDEGSSISGAVRTINFVGAAVTASASGDEVTVNVSSGTGTVTSVAVSGGSTGLTTSGGPITTTGTITLGGTLAVASGGTGTATPGLVAGTNITSITGSWPNQTINAGGGSGTVTSVAASGGTGISISGSPITTSGTLTITNTAPDQTVALTQGGTTTITGTYPNFTISSADQFVGTVTSVTGTSPVASSGGTTPAISLSAGYGDTLNPYASKTANFVLAAPNGTAGVPTFRAVVAADIPTLNQSTTGSAATLTTGRTIEVTGDLAYTSPSFDGSTNVTAAGTLATVNSNVGSFTNASVTVNAKGLVTAVSNGTAGGTVTSVAATVPAFLSISGSPVTTSGTLAIGLSGTALPVDNGGTGATTLTANNVLLGNGTSAVQFVAPSTNGNVLTSNGTTWTSAAAGGGFPSGTAILFAQTAAPTGFTKSTTHNDKALRVVSGAASSGGTTAFSTVFANQTPTITTSGLSAGATTLTTAQMPSHSHTYPQASGYTGTGLDNQATGGNISSSSTGGGGSHTHTVSGTATSTAITLNVQYVDVIIATKD